MWQIKQRKDKHEETNFVKLIYFAMRLSASLGLTHYKSTSSQKPSSSLFSTLKSRCYLNNKLIPEIFLTEQEEKHYFYPPSFLSLVTMPMPFRPSPCKRHSVIHDEDGGKEKSKPPTLDWVVRPSTIAAQLQKILGLLFRNEVKESAFLCDHLCTWRTHYFVLEVP